MIGPIAMALLGVLAGSGTPCESLKSLSLPNTTVTAAEQVPAGPLEPAGGGRAGRGPAASQAVVPAHCRVAMVLTPSPDSHIEMEVWLPLENWNGKFQAVGNGGWAGVISYGAMATALQNGYATASTDTGHKGGSASFAVGHPEKLIDFGVSLDARDDRESQGRGRRRSTVGRRGSPTTTAARPAAARA